MPEPEGIQIVSAANCVNHREWLEQLQAMSEEELRDWFEAQLDSMTYEERSNYLRALEEFYGGGWGCS